LKTIRKLSPAKWPSTSLLTIFDLTDLKVASGLCAKNPCGTIYEITSVLNSSFYENIDAHY